MKSGPCQFWYIGDPDLCVKGDVIKLSGKVHKKT